MYNNIKMSRQKNKKIEFAAAGPLLPGTISTAMAKCGKKKCRCKSDPEFLHGPYYRWTGAIDGKRTTITLSEEEAHECSRRIENWKKLQRKIELIKEKALKDAPWNNR